MHRHRVAAAALLLTLGGVTLALAAPHPQDSPPTSAEALQARGRYQEDLRQLAGEYARRRGALRQRYIRELDAARKRVLTREDLDEAQRLLMLKRQIEAGTASEVTGAPFEILQARVVAEGRWLDATAEVRKLVKGDALRYDVTPPAPGSVDLAPGIHKTMVIVYACNGEVFLSTTRDNQGVDLPPRP